LSKKNSALNSTINTLQNKLKTQQSHIESLTIQYSESTSLIQAHKHTISQLKSQPKRDDSGPLRATIQKLNTTINGLNVKIKNQSITLANQVNAIKMHKDTIEKLQREKNLSKAQMINAQDNLKKIENQRKEINLLRLTIREKEMEKINNPPVDPKIMIKLQESENQVLELNNALSQALDENKALNNLTNGEDGQEVSNLKSLIRKLELKISTLEKLSCVKMTPTLQEGPSHDDLAAQVVKIMSQLECPISLEEIKSPVVCPSGHTIEHKVYEDLVKKGMNDPFSGEKLDSKIIVNRFMTNVKEILQRSDAMKPVKEETKQ